MSELALNTLAAEINILHDEAERHANMAVVYAARCGAKLLEAKEGLDHGQWLPWLKVNCRVGDRQSARYMKLAQELPELLDSNSTLKSNLPGIAQALALITADDETKAIVQEKLDAGQSVTVKEIEELKREAQAAKNRAAELAGEVDSSKSIIRLLEDKLKQPPPIIEREVVPHDYEDSKRRAKEASSVIDGLQEDIRALRQRMQADIDTGVKQHIKKRQDELDQLERRKQQMEDSLAKYQDDIRQVNAKDVDYRAQRDASQAILNALVKLSADLMTFEYDPDSSLERQWWTVRQAMLDGASAVERFMSAKLETA